MLTALFLCTSSIFAVSFLDSRGRVDVIMYHRICSDDGCRSPYCITPEEFENDLKFFKSRSFESVFASSLADSDLHGRRIVVITFDDGYKSDIEFAVPLLEKYGFCATFYVFGAAIGTPGYLSEDDLKCMSAKSCAEIGNHTYALHEYAPSTLNLLYGDPAMLDKIITDFSKNSSYLESVTGKPVTTAAYPNGEYSAEADRRLKLSGVKTTFSTEPYSFSKVLPDKPIGRKTRISGAEIENLMK